jgi:hypothetical protein
LGSRLYYKEDKEVTGSEKMEVIATEHLPESFCPFKQEKKYDFDWIS